MLAHTPDFAPTDAVDLARRFFGVDAAVAVLPGERDQNFRLDSPDGQRSVLKIANGGEDAVLVEAQNRAMLHVSERTGLCQAVLPTIGGDLIVDIASPAGLRHCVRRLSWLPGEPLAAVRARPAGLLRRIGVAIGRIDAALQDFDHPAFHRDLPWDLALATEVVQGNARFIEDSVLRSVVERLAAHFEMHTASRLEPLRRSIIHNDANDHNIIVNAAGAGSDVVGSAAGDGEQAERCLMGEREVSGIIDFGDMLYSWTVGDLAVAMAYAVLDQPDPLHAATRIVEGYNAVFPLTADEIAVVFDLARTRLCVSACMAAVQQAQRPDDPYLAVSQAPIRRTLPVLEAIHGRLAEAMFRNACGLAPVPAAMAVRDWLEAEADGIGPVLDIDRGRDTCAVLDLGVDSPLISGDPELNEEPALTPRLMAHMRAVGASAGVARYDEARLLNTGPAYGEAGAAGAERRTVHLGIDLYRPPGTPVMAPLDGTVFAFADNASPQDYGPVIMLEHRTGDGTPFYTLYGHLSAESLVGLFPGRAIVRGERIGTIGEAVVNGGWTPHVHVQLVVDPLGLGTEFPGICRASERAVWKDFSPDPNLVLQLPGSLFPPPRPLRAATLAARRAHVGPNLSIAYREPLQVVRGWMQYLYDETGRRYTDAYNNVPHVGHCHPRVVEAGQRQMAVLNTNTRYLHDNLSTFADRLCATLPDPLSVCWFVNSASEANELALRMARAHTGRLDTIVLEAAYHGHTTTLIDISPYKHDGPGGSGPPPWVHAAPLADPYRGPWKADDPEAGIKYAESVRSIIQKLGTGDASPAAFIAESCPSVAGQILFPPGYLKAVYEHVRAAGGVCIADEVQTGYGRVGTHFYAFEAQDVVPDIVVLGKPIGNGHPIAAVVTTPGIAASFDNGMEFFSTFGGNTVSCAVGLAVLDVVQDEKLQQHALRVGSHLLERLRPLGDRFPIIGDVRGSGLFIGVELVRDRETLEPAGTEAAFICDRMRECGILIGTDGPFHNVLKIRPPMPFSEADASALATTLETILEQELPARTS